MSDLISRKALINIFEERMHNDNVMCPIIKVLDVLEIVDDAPTVEAKEVVHGEWVRKDDTICYWYECSNCCSRILKNRFGKDVYSNFCPQCGCDMKGENNVE